MKRFNVKNINTPEYWDTHQTATDFGLRQQKYADLVNNRKKVVELGCGLSPFLFRINNDERWGLDFSFETIEQAEQMYPGVKYVIGDATKTPFKKGEFDAVVAGEIIEHLERPSDLIEEMERICKKGGIMVISTPILEFEDPEHLWQFDVDDFFNLDFNDVEIIESKKFPGRKYIFAWKIKK